MTEGTSPHRQGLAASGLAEARLDPAVVAVARDIYKSVNFATNKIRAVMNLPAVSQTDSETLALALHLILEKYFTFHLPGEELMHLRAGRSVRIDELRDDDLPGRQVAILLSPEHRSCEVVGVAPEDGRDGYSELLFGWRKMAGLVDERGNIDLKRLNTFPHVAEKEALAVIHLATPGKPGISSAGKAMKQRPGRDCKVRYNEATIARHDDPGLPGQYSLIARKAGIVDFVLLQENEPGSLSKIDIVDTITVNGDVDYRIGDQGSLTNADLQCQANIVVKGDVRGIFTLQSHGFIHVAGAMEGRRIVAGEIKARVITSGTTAFAKGSLVAENIIQARVEAQQITLLKTSNESTLTATELITLKPGVSCLGLTIHTKRLESKKNRFSGRNTITLSTPLFGQEDELLADRAQLVKEMERQSPAMKDAAEQVVNQLVSLESFIGRTQPKIDQQLRSMLLTLKEKIVASFKTFTTPLEDDLVPLCYKLQAALGERNFHESVLRKVDVVVKTLQRYNDILGVQKEKYDQLAVIDQRREELKRQLVDHTGLQFEDLQLVGENAEICVRCGEEQLTLTKDSQPDGPFAVTYEVPENYESLKDGRLVLNQDFF